MTANVICNLGLSLNCTDTHYRFKLHDEGSRAPDVRLPLTCENACIGQMVPNVKNSVPALTSTVARPVQECRAQGFSLKTIALTT